MTEGDAPHVGQIVDHHFLWVAEHAAGQIEARKARPCLIIAVERGTPDAPPRVTILPITSQAPRAGRLAIEIPDDIKIRIGLDRQRRAWLVTEEANVFTWPGFDLVPQRNGGFVRGVVTRGFFAAVREAVVNARSRGRPRRIERDEE